MLTPIVLLAVVGFSTAADDCAAAYKCKNPWVDLRTITRCRLTTLLDVNGLETVTQLLAQQTCNGSTIDDIGSNFMSTMQKGASSQAYSKMSSVLVPFSQCLSQKGSNMNKAMSAVGAGMKKAIGATYLEVQKAIKSFKGKCTTTEMYNAIGKKFCPLYTKVLVQKVINATRKEMGNSWTCAPDKLSPTILNFTTYITK